MAISLNSIAAQVTSKSWKTTWKTTAEIEQFADFSQIRYAQCWEDADVMLAAMQMQPGQTGLSIASAGDNTLALLANAPKRVIAIDLSFPQIACLALRVAAYRQLNHAELLTLIGSLPAVDPAETGQHRLDLYSRCRTVLSRQERQFWDDRLPLIAQGIGTIGKFERYLELFRNSVLPWIHNAHTISQLLQIQSLEQRKAFYAQRWNTWRWRLLFHLFFSRQLMGLLGRDPSFFRYVEESVAATILQRTEAVVIRCDPTENPYLQWLVTGHHQPALPYALRPENFEAIRRNVDCLEWHCTTLEAFLAQSPANSIDHFNLSNVFEWMSPEHYHQILAQLVRVGRSQGRLVYWNLLVDRQRPLSMATQLQPLTELAQALYQQNRVFFYKNLVIEEIL